MRTTLPPRVRKFIGTIFIIILVVLYAPVAVVVATSTLADAPWYAHTLYFLFSSVLFWIIPTMIIIKWMASQDHA